MNDFPARAWSDEDSSSGTASRVLGWGAFLACSWTWCIGMFLPVLLIRDLGWGGYVAFALPNIVGAAVFGVTLARPGASARFIEAHRTMIWAFSVVTIAFQAYFVGVLIQPSPMRMEQVAVLLGTVVVAIGIHSLNGKPALLRLASIACWVISAALMIIAARTGHEGPPAAIAQAAPHKLELSGLGLVCALGFAFCPYLDRTFHEARMRLPGNPGTIAFILGFCVLFATMIAFTVLYARDGTFAAVPADGTRGLPLGISLAPVVLAHLATQLGFTIGAHIPWAVAEAPKDMPSDAPARARLWTLAPCLAGLLISVVAIGANGLYGLGGFELAYRGFMAFYGLVFPAYVWLCATPLGESSKPTTRMLRVWIAAMAIATPFYWVGFMQLRYEWLIPGVAIVALSKLFAGRRSVQTAPTGG